MRNYGLRATMVLACVILVLASGACQAFAFFDSMTSMFTAVSLPQSSHYQDDGFKNSNFMWDKLDRVSQESTDNSAQQQTGKLQNYFTLNLKPATQGSSDSRLMNTILTPGVNTSSNPAMSSYDSFMKKYGNGKGNIFES